MAAFNLLTQDNPVLLTDAQNPVKATAAAAPASVGNLFEQYNKANSFDLSGAAGTMKEADKWTVDDNSLVSKRLQSLLSADSPYLQMARTRAAQTANSRGLLNSSMAAGAGEAAAIQSGLPIAQQDASTSASAGQFNAEQGNLFARDQNNFQREGAIRQLGIAADADTQGRNLQFQQDERLGGQAFQTGERVGDQTFRTGERLGSEDFSTRQQASDQTFRTGERLGTEAFDTKQQESDQKFRTGERVGDQEFRAADREDNQTFSKEQTTADQDFRSREATVAFSRQLEQLGFQSNLENAKLPVQYALSISQQAQQGVNAILADSTLSPEAKQGAIQNLVDYSNRTIDWAETFFGASINAIPSATSNGEVTPESAAGIVKGWFKP